MISSFNRLTCVYWIAITYILISTSQAKPLDVRSKPELNITNTSSVPIVAIRCDQQTVTRIEAGKSASLSAEGCAGSPVGRIDLAHWGRALKNLSEDWAPYHLRTAGHLLDAVSLGPSGEPELSENIQTLARVNQEVIETWVAESPLGQALLARAAEHAPIDLVKRLLSDTSPDMTQTDWPKAYASLPSVAESMRSAIEAHGIESIPLLIDSKTWAVDRGFINPRLALAFPSIRSQVIQKLRADTQTQRRSIEERVRLFAEAHEAGEQMRLADLAVEAALIGNQPRTQYDHAVEQRLACGGLDAGARVSIKKGYWLAALAYLTLAVTPCGDMPSVRSRIAELFRARGDAAYQRVQLKTASDWFEGALWFAGEAGDRARLADTQAELAIFRFREGAHELGAEYLARAKELDPLRPRVLEAGRFKPSVDSRARFGVVVIILFLGFFAIRRLKKALFDDGKARR